MYKFKVVRKLLLLATISVISISASGCYTNKNPNNERSSKESEVSTKNIVMHEETFTECNKYAVTLCSAPVSISNGLQSTVGLDYILHIISESQHIYIIEYPGNTTAKINKDFVRLVSINSENYQYYDSKWLVIANA